MDAKTKHSIQNFLMSEYANAPDKQTVVFLLDRLQAVP